MVFRLCILISVLLATVLAPGCVAQQTPEAGTVSLPDPGLDSDTSVEEALRERRSVRTFADEPLSLAEAGQVLWAAQGITDEHGRRTAPSAGARYPLEVYLVAGAVSGLEPGVYGYDPGGHRLVRVVAGDLRDELRAAALDQEAASSAPAAIVITAFPERTTARYGERGMAYVYMEAGHAAQNVYLQAEALDLATVAIGAFNDEEVRRILNLSGNETPLYIMPIGKGT
jgi:SagB-type dehydrogenase family enzyme